MHFLLSNFVETPQHPGSSNFFNNHFIHPQNWKKITIHNFYSHFLFQKNMQEDFRPPAYHLKGFAQN